MTTSEKLENNSTTPNQVGTGRKSYWFIWERFGIYIILVIFGMALTLLSDRFMTFQNLSNVLRQVATLAIISVGLLTTVTTGKVDLTIGAFSGLTGALFAGWSIQFGVVPALLMGFGFAVLWGLLNGFLVTRGKSLDVIVTLAMMMIAQGLTLLYTNGRPVIGFPEEMRFLGNADVAGIPMLVIVAVLMMLVIHIVLRYTAFGRELYAIGGNLEAARLSGIPANRRIITAYVISALLSALAGLVMIGRVASAQPTAGVGDEFTAVGAVLIGGASMSGGVGSVPGTLAGVLILGMISNGLNLLHVNPYFQYVVKGLIILFAILMDQFGRKSR
ncbi:MAG: ABC transporter permease [Chloroflexi bacterium]|nr:ABC transporter permease [Anaerolineaceae bacterium]NMB87265.1 ABC transporter permease [Chloroflexota bacterium]